MFSHIGHLGQMYPNSQNIYNHVFSFFIMLHYVDWWQKRLHYTLTYEKHRNMWILYKPTTCCINMDTCGETVFQNRESHSSYRADRNAKWHNLHKSYQCLFPMPLDLQWTTRGLPVDHIWPGRHLHNDSRNLTHHFHRIAYITPHITQTVMYSAHELCGNKG